jgi:Lar family restriction alleviation protein
MSADSYATAPLPCPFCGEVKIQDAAVPNTNGNRRFMRCLGCGAEGPWNKGGLDALARWNTRLAGPCEHEWQLVQEDPSDGLLFDSEVIRMHLSRGYLYVKRWTGDWYRMPFNVPLAATPNPERKT